MLTMLETLQVGLMDLITLGVYILIAGIAWGKLNTKLSAISARMEKLEALQVVMQTKETCAQTHTSQTTLLNAMTTSILQRLERIERLLDEEIKHLRAGIESAKK